MQKSSFNKLSILLFIIVILSSCNKDNGIEEISESYIEIKVLRISKDNTKTPIYNAIAYIYYDIAPIDLANYTDKGNGIYSNGKNTIIPNQVKRTNIDGYLEIKPEEVIAIGDNINDKKMIENAGLGVVMQGSTPVVTEVADYITDSNNDEGVAKILQKYYKNINF